MAGVMNYMHEVFFDGKNIPQVPGNFCRLIGKVWRRKDIAAKFYRNFLMVRIFKARTGGKIFFAAVAVFFALQKIQGKELYLALVGPPSIRFEAMATNDEAFTKELALPGPPDTNAAVSVGSTNSAAAPNAGSGPKLPNNAATGKNSPGNLSGAAKNAKGNANPANNLLSTVPQMINPYLKPNGNTENDTSSYQPGDTIFVPPELGFVPPMPGQSRATYQVR